MGSVHFHPNLDFYVCKNCRNDIADELAAMGARSAVDSGLQGVQLFFNVTNVVIDEKVLRKAGPHTVADIHCAKCMDHIGFKYIDVSTEVERIIRVGDFQLIMEKLEFCQRSNVRVIGDKEADDFFAYMERIAAAERMKKQKQEQTAEMGEQEQAETVEEQLPEDP